MAEWASVGGELLEETTGLPRATEVAVAACVDVLFENDV